MKDYWTWTCHKCGHDDNRNHNWNCTQCGQQIRCEQSGGHHWKPGQEFCGNGCGRRESGTYDLTQRREDY